MEALTQPFEVHVASRSFAGLPACGDLPVAQPFANGFLLGAIDGLGHGTRGFVMDRHHVQHAEPGLQGAAADLVGL